MSVVVERITDLFDTTCAKQFESMRCGIVDAESPKFDAYEDVNCITIECTSEDLKLRLKLSANKSFLTNTMPAISGQNLDSLAYQKDWCLELGNRFLGRLKNKLLSHGCVLAMGLPSLISYSSMNIDDESSADVVRRVFEIASSDKESAQKGVIECVLLIHILGSEVALDDYEDEDEDWFDESELHHL